VYVCACVNLTEVGVTDTLNIDRFKPIIHYLNTYVVVCVCVCKCQGWHELNQTI